VTIFRYEDLPGMIGRVGRVFGEHGIDISPAAVGHTADGVEGAEHRRTAMVVTTDAPVSDAVVEQIVALEGFVDGWAVDLGRDRGLPIEALGASVAWDRRRSRDSLSLASAMRAVGITKHGGRGFSRFGSAQTRRPAAARSAFRSRRGINFADVMAGLYADAPKTPCVLCYEVAGTVLEVGKGVTPGAGPRPTHFGGYVSQVVVSAGDVVALPEGLSFEQGAAIPVNYATACGSRQVGRAEAGRAHVGALRRWRRRDRGDADRQACRGRGFGTASPGKHENILALGVDRAVDYTQTGWERGIGRFDVILDAVDGKSFRTGYDLLAPGRAHSLLRCLLGRLRRRKTSSRRCGRSCGCRASGRSSRCSNQMR
jgi:hypothetical protein